MLQRRGPFLLVWLATALQVVAPLVLLPFAPWRALRLVDVDPWDDLEEGEPDGDALGADAGPPGHGASSPWANADSNGVTGM
jgi:hypothetical protein